MLQINENLRIPLHRVRGMRYGHCLYPLPSALFMKPLTQIFWQEVDVSRAEHSYQKIRLFLFLLQPNKSFPKEDYGN